MTRPIRTLAVAAVALGTSFAIDTQTNTAEASCVSEPYVGSLCVTAANWCPRGYAFANGATLDIGSNQILYAVIGTWYGGDGRTTFKLPDLRGRSVVSYGQGVGMTEIRIGEAYGPEANVMSERTMAEHSHGATFVGQSGSAAVNVDVSTKSATKSAPAQGDYLAAANNGERTPAPENAYIAAGDAGTTVTLGGVRTEAVTPHGTVTVAASGNSQAIDNRGPRLGMTYCIAVKGLFPPRT